MSVPVHLAQHTLLRRLRQQGSRTSWCRCEKKLIDEKAAANPFADSTPTAPPASGAAFEAASEAALEAAAAKLEEMGFGPAKDLKDLLKSFNGDISKTVEALAP